jgi:peptidyl-prolyl cis-trans isomerase C
VVVLRNSFVALFCSAALLRASSSAAADTTVVTVGSAKVTVDELSRRLAALAPFQLATYGSTPAEIRRGYVDKVLVPELLRDQEATQRQLERTPRVQDRYRDVLRRALEQQLRDAADQSVTPEDVDRAVTTQRSTFEQPRRIRIWRILTATEDAARDALRRAAGSEGPTEWGRLAREASLDKATSMRHGDLGFVRSDGQTDVPSVRVDPALFAAAERLKDGQVAPDPVREGDKFAAVWRRGTLPATELDRVQAAPRVRELLVRERVEHARQRLVDQLRRSFVTVQDAAPLDAIELNPFGSEAERARPGTAPKVVVRGAAQRNAPEPTDQGKR